VSWVVLTDPRGNELCVLTPAGTTPARRPAPGCRTGTAGVGAGNLGGGRAPSGRLEGIGVARLRARRCRRAANMAAISLRSRVVGPLHERGHQPTAGRCCGLRTSNPEAASPTTPTCLTSGPSPSDYRRAANSRPSNADGVGCCSKVTHLAPGRPTGLVAVAALSSHPARPHPPRPRRRPPPAHR
jgi:hypothetical protein